MNGPTMRRSTCGKARRMLKPPRSTLRGTTTRSMASHAGASPATGSFPGKKLIIPLQTVEAYVVSTRQSSRARSTGLERLRSGRLAGCVERNLFDPRLGLAQKLLAPALELLAPLVDRHGLFERYVAALAA